MSHAWTKGQPLVVQKSRFLGLLANATSSAQARELLHQLKTQDYVGASHYISALRIRCGSTSFVEEAHDNGEPPAGSRLLNLLKKNRMENVLLVVMRWYGGRHLGPLRFRAIDGAATSCVEEFKKKVSQK